MSNDRKAQLLGMNFVTARNRLDRDLLFAFAKKLGHKCHRCGKDLTRDTFSVDHIENWSMSDDPVKAFFDIDNVAFSHMWCNTKERTERSIKKDHGLHMYDRHGCRCSVCKNAKSESFVYDKEKRRDKYVRLGT